MSSRNRIDPNSDLYNDINRYPFHRDPDSGLYDLDLWDDLYWTQFRDFLDMTAKRDIIVQIEIWDRWDYGEVWGGAYTAEAWSAHPFNPKDNVNYTESTASEEWSRYWARFVRDRAVRAGVNIELTEMWNAHDLTDPMHRRTFDHPDLYSFVDTSQNNLRDGQIHWNNEVRRVPRQAGRREPVVARSGGERSLPDVHPW